MRLIDILKPENIKVPLESTTKNDAIAELVNLLAKSGTVTDDITLAKLPFEVLSVGDSVIMSRLTIARPVGSVSLTDTAAVVGPVPEFFAVMV